VTASVEPLTVYPGAWGPFIKGSCHLTADTVAELHEFAARIGMRRSWFQSDTPAGKRVLPPVGSWHYDLTPAKRAAAVRAGAVETDWAGMAALFRAAGRETQRRGGDR
jgi:hypothetical protein